MARRIAAVVFSLGCVHAGSTMALGLGELSLESFLNEPLRARVDLLDTGRLQEDQIKIRLATAEDFKRMGVDRAYFLTSISFDVTVDDRGRGQIVLTSQEPVLEPYLDFIIEARWPSGRLLREYTVLVDPPVFSDKVPVVSASARVAEVEGTPAPAQKKTEGVATSGTRVDVRETGLAPGEMPRRGFNAGTAEEPQSGNRYMVHRDDTLWRIAERARPAGASVHQTMLDIQRLNPDAFIDGNINLIKAGYIIYLPTEGEIRSGDSAQAMAEVREQNAAWREGRAGGTQGGPSLRITAEPEPAAAAAPGAGQAPAAETATPTGAVAQEELEKSTLEREELQQRLQSMEQQVETLQRIVSLKDDQIAALQSALAGTESAPVGQQPALADLVAGESTEGTAETAPEGGEAAATGGAEEPVVATGETEFAVAEPAPVKAPAPAPAERQAAASGGLMDYLWYLVGALVLAVLAFVLVRRRSGQEEAAAVPAERDSFADVQLRDQPLEISSEEETALAGEPVAGEKGPALDSGTRGYGQRKHDEYASDVDASDALAEADIYIAYGRYPQAVDLLQNALRNDPDNAEYRLKLIETFLEMGDRTSAIHQFTQIQQSGDPVSLGRAEALMGDVSAGARHAPPGGAALESDFSELEIEEAGDDDLDLSADFERKDLDPDEAEEDLVIAHDSNGLSTKLDLARAYLDMGDEDGARQILEEVAAEGSEELQEEARDLLERIG